MKVDELIGERLGNFVLLEKIGSGGMGTVYKAKQVGLDRTTAVKILRPDLVVQNRDFVKRFLREAKTSALVSHPNVVQVFTVGTKEGLYYMAMEFVEGESVGAKLDRRALLSEREAVIIAIQAAQGLKAAGEKGLIHRDVKPDNLLVTPENVVKVADFGLAKMVNMQSRLTREGVTIGTIAYMSPEQIRGEECDFRCDIYSLGATLHHMVTGRQPFEGESAVAVAYKHINEPPQRLRDVNPIVSLGLEAVAWRMLSKEADDRHDSMEELIEDLEAVLAQGHPASTNTTALVELGIRPGRKAPTGPRPWMAAAALGGVGLFVLLLVLIFGGSEQPAKTVPEPLPVPGPVHELSVIAPKADEWLRSAQVDVKGTVSKGCREVTVNGAQATLKGGSFSTRVWLVGDDPKLTVLALFDDGKKRTVEVAVALDPDPPVIEILWPPSGRLSTRDTTVTLKGRVSDKHLASIRVDDANLPIGTTTFAVPVRLKAEEEKVLVVEATDKAGNRSMTEVHLIRDLTPPVITLLDFPADGQLKQASDRFVLRFKVNEEVRRVVVNGTPLKAKGFRFETAFTLGEGHNPIHVEVEDLAGNPAELIEKIRFTKATSSPARPLEKTFDRVLSRLDRAADLCTKIGILEAFLAQNPSGAVRQDAMKMLKDLKARKSAQEEKSVYDKASADARAAENPFEKIRHLQTYLRRFPQGKYAVRLGEEFEQVRRKDLPQGVVRTERPHEYVNERDGAVMLLVPEGNFTMGSREAEVSPFLSKRPDLDMKIYEDEIRRVRIHLSAYFIYKYEVSNEQFAGFLREYGSIYTRKRRKLIFDHPWGIRLDGGSFRPAQGMGRHPVVNVTWFGADAYARWAGVSLPSEAQWEKAARWDPSGSRERIFPWGNTYKPGLCNSADLWFKKTIHRQSDWLKFNRMVFREVQTLPVDSMPEGDSAVGCHHMAGNVWEWCLDWYSGSYYTSEKNPRRDPVNTEKTYTRVIRGGSFARAHLDCRGAKRSRWGEPRHSESVGFRCARKAR